MARKKIRKFKTREQYEEMFNEYLVSNKESLIAYVVERLGYGSLEEMRSHEMTGCWFDCGWVIVKPTNKDHEHEWKLDEDGWNEMIINTDIVYPTQSTTIQFIIVSRMLVDLNVAGELFVSVRLD